MDDVPDLDVDAFEMGEAVAAMLAAMGVSSLSVGGEVLVHAARLGSPPGPLLGFGDAVSVGDLVEVYFEGPGRRSLETVAVLNHYDVLSGDLVTVRQEPTGYHVSFAALSGAFGRRTFRLLAPAPAGYVRHDSASLASDAVVAALDAHFALGGRPRPASPVDLPVVVTGSRTLHAALAGQSRSVCDRPLASPASPTAPLFCAGPGVCPRCVAKEASLAASLGDPSLSFSDRSLRRELAVRVYSLRLR